MIGQCRRQGFTILKAEVTWPRDVESSTVAAPGCQGFRFRGVDLLVLHATYYAHSSRLRWLRSPEPANRAARIYPKLYYLHLLLAQTSSLASTPRVEVLIVSIALSAPNRLLLYCIHVVRYILAHNMAFNRPAEPAHMCLVHIRESEFIMVFQIPVKSYL